MIYKKARNDYRATNLASELLYDDAGNYKNDKAKALGALLYGAPTGLASFVGSQVLANALAKKKTLKHFVLSNALPASYLAYVIGKKGNGMLDLYNGSSIVDSVAYPINDAFYGAVEGMSRGVFDSAMGYNNPRYKDNSEADRYKQTNEYGKERFEGHIDRRRTEDPEHFDERFEKSIMAPPKEDK